MIADPDGRAAPSIRLGDVLLAVLAGRSADWIARECGARPAALAGAFDQLRAMAHASACPDLAGLLDRAWPQTAAAASVRWRVLLADDHPVNRVVVQSLLEGLPLEIDLAVDGAQAVARFREGSFDVVLMDVDMPVMDGVAAVRAIRVIERERGAAPARIAMVTAHDGATVRRDCLDAGANDYLVKPINARVLHALFAESAEEAGR
jgi:CheY-like chemotaxis protein